MKDKTHTDEYDFELEGVTLRENWTQGRISLQRSDYRKLAKKVGLIWIGLGGSIDEKTGEVTEGKLPHNVREKTLWYCSRCTRGYLHKRYHDIKYHNAKCYCRTNLQYDENDYIEAGKELGIAWVGKKLPANVQERTLWLGIDGEVFEASKKELFNFGKPPRVIFRNKIRW